MVVCLKTLLLIQSKTLPKNYLNGIILLVKKKKIIQLSIKLKKKKSRCYKFIYFMCQRSTIKVCFSHHIYLSLIIQIETCRIWTMFEECKNEILLKIGYTYCGILFRKDMCFCAFKL